VMHKNEMVFHKLSQSKLSSSPVSSLGVISDGVIGTEADPLGNGSVLFLLFTQNSLNAERLV